MKKATSLAVAALAFMAAWPLMEAPAQAETPSTPAPPASTVSVAEWEPHHWMYTNEGTIKGGKAHFYPDGDRVGAEDLQSDGKGVQVDVWNVTKDPDVWEYQIELTTGEGTEKWRAGREGQPYNLAEGDCFRFRVRLVDNGKVVEGSTDNAQWRNKDDSAENCDGVE